MCSGTHPFIPAAKTVQVLQQFIMDNQRAENVFWATKATDWTEEEIALLAGKFYAFWVAMQPHMASDVIGTRTVLTDWSSATGFRYIDDAIRGLAGGSSSPPMPNHVSFRWNFYTGHRGRGYTGGFFWPGLVFADVEANNVKQSLLNIQDGYIQGLIDSLATDSQSLAVVSFCHNNAWRTAAQVSQVTSFGYSDETIDSQRRRLPNHNRHRR